MPTSRSARVLQIALAALLLAAAGPSRAVSPSFLCKHAKAWVEVTVCGSSALAQRDLDLAVVHARLLRSAKATSRTALDREQQQWWASLSACKTAADPVACLAGRYDERIASIKVRPDYPGEGRQRAAPPSEPTPIVRDGRGWTRALSSYQKALRACNEESPAPIGKLLVAWPTDDPDSVALRVVDWNLKEWVCIAHREGHKVFRYEASDGASGMPAPGPVYHLGGDKPPPRCSGATQVVDVNGKPVGWISDKDC